MKCWYTIELKFTRDIADSNLGPEERLKRFLCKTVTYLTQNKGITMLMFSEASHNNDAALKNNLSQIFNNQKILVSKIILDGINIGKWDSNIPVENVAMLYMGIPVSLNVELVLNGGEFHIESFCSKMKLFYISLYNKYLASRKSRIGNDLETSEILWTA